MDYLDASRRALMALPDGRIYRAAMKAAERVLNRSQSVDDQQHREQFGEISHLLGTFHLDPYSAKFSNADYQAQIDRWRQSLKDELGTEFNTIPPDQLAMPSPAEALTLAINFLKKATSFRKESLRPLSFKALGQAIEWLKIAGGSADEEAARQANREALKSIDPEANPHVWVTAFSQLAHQGEKMDFAPLNNVLKRSLDDFIQQIGGRNTLELIDHAAYAFSHGDPLRSLELFQLSQPLIDRFADSRSRDNRLGVELNVILRGLAPTLPPDERALSARAEQLRAQAQTESWDARTLAAGLILLAASSQERREEAIGLSLINEAVVVAPVFTDQHSNAIRRLGAILQLGSGVNGYNRRDWGAAIAGYTLALAEFLQLRLDEMAMYALGRIDDIAPRQGDEVTVEFSKGLMPLALRLEANLGEPARDLMLSAARRASASGFNSKVHPNQIFLIWQMGKGLRFASTLTGASRSGWNVIDSFGETLLNQIAEFPVDLRIRPPDDDPFLEEAILLSPYRSGDGAMSENDEAGRLARISHTF
jgi:hypothetical protein